MTPTPTSQHHSSGSSDTKCETVDLAPRIGAWYGPAAAQYSVGDGPLQLDPERANGAPRGDFFGLLRAASCRRRASRARLAGCGQRPIRPLAALRSRVYDLSRARAARPVRCGRVNRPPEVQIGRRRDQLGSTTATESQRGRPLARWPAAIDGELGAGRRAALPLVGARRRLLLCAAGLRRARSSTKCIGTRSHHPPSRHGWRAVRRRPAGAASVAARLSDAPAWTRRWDADARRRRCRLVAVRGAATHPYIVLVQVPLLGRLIN